MLKLVAALLNGAGLRLLEGLRLRIQDSDTLQWKSKICRRNMASATMKLFWIIGIFICMDSGELLAQEIDQRELEKVVMAAEQGDVSAQAKLGFMYHYGKGVTKDLAKALEWYHSAAEQGHAETQATLGTMYLYGRNGLASQERS